MASPKAAVWRWIARHRAAAPVRRAAGLAERFVAAYENRGAYLFEDDGELQVIARYADPSATTVLDVGANVGDWTRSAVRAWPAATFHLFEPVPSTFAKLQANVDGLPVVLNQAALGATPGRATIYEQPTHVLSSMLASEGTPHEVDVLSGDDYLDRHRIDHVAFLKIDTEGFDHEVLVGFGRALADKRIDVVQFEYGPWALDTHHLLRDTWTMLEDVGMEVGKIYPTGVEFGAWRKQLEDFTGLNFLAVRSH
jgi:FkbM family methyltransferase